MPVTDGSRALLALAASCLVLPARRKILLVGLAVNFPHSLVVLILIFAVFFPSFFLAH